MADPIVRLEEVSFAYPDGRFRARIPQFELRRGERVACIGASGAGKTTFLHLLTGVLSPRSGLVSLAGQDLSRVNEETRRALRITTVGMVFQQFALLDYLSVRDNILLPYLVSPALELNKSVRQRARELAHAMGIEAYLNRKPRQLSQGERQRIALCRSLITSPPLVLADEPTGNLDPERSEGALDLLFDVCDQNNSALLVVTHDATLLPRFGRVVAIDECMEVQR